MHHYNTIIFYSVVVKHLSHVLISYVADMSCKLIPCLHTLLVSPNVIFLYVVMFPVYTFIVLFVTGGHNYVDIFHISS